MSTACITEEHSCMSYKCETRDQLSNLIPCKTLKGPQMAPQEKIAGSDALVVEHPDEQYASTESNSSGNNSVTQPDDENSVNNLPLSDSPPTVNGAQSNGQNGFNRQWLAHRPNHSEVGLHFRRRKRLFKAANTPVAPRELYSCQKCDFSGRNDDELHVHSRVHYPYECGDCGFLSDSRESVLTHLTESHSEVAASKREEFILFHGPKRAASSPKNRRSKIKAYEETLDKPRRTPCKVCHNFIGNNKMEYFIHLKAKHSNRKLLPCHLCPFIALHAHHLLYHYRNHYGSRPCVCEECGYVCNNKSMLNSHYKSHSDVYQYSCQDCQYMTKYLHSLKMHLRKYNHQPGQILNKDGSVNNNSVIDVHGKRRGPKGSKRKSADGHGQDAQGSPKSKSPPSTPPFPVPQWPPQDVNVHYSPHIQNNYSLNMCARPGPSEATGYLPYVPIFRCAYCEFEASSFQQYHSHLCSHASNKDRSDYPAFLKTPYGFGSLGQFGPCFNPDSLSRNMASQSNSVERRNINEGRNMNIASDIHFQNFVNNRNNIEAMTSYNAVNKNEESFNGMAMNPEMLASDGPKQGYRKRKENKVEKFLKSCTPSPNAMIAVKQELNENRSGVGSPSTSNHIDSAPLDLSAATAEKMALERLIRLARSSSVSPKFESEGSKATTRKTNRRKGRAFKLNQYAMESEPLSDGAEASSKLAFGSEIKKSVPRINFKPTLNATKWNGLNSPEPKFLPFPELTYTEPNCADPQTTRHFACWCPHCDMDLTTPCLLDHHSSYHSKSDIFTCAKCGLQCNDKVGFNSHIMCGSRINGNCINVIKECRS